MRTNLVLSAVVAAICAFAVSMMGQSTSTPPLAPQPAATDVVTDRLDATVKALERLVDKLYRVSRIVPPPSVPKDESVPEEEPVMGSPLGPVTTLFSTRLDLPPRQQMSFQDIDLPNTRHVLYRQHADGAASCISASRPIDKLTENQIEKLEEYAELWGQIHDARYFAALALAERGECEMYETADLARAAFSARRDPNEELLHVEFEEGFGIFDRPTLTREADVEQFLQRQAELEEFFRDLGGGLMIAIATVP